MSKEDLSKSTSSAGTRAMEQRQLGVAGSKAAGEVSGDSGTCLQEEKEARRSQIAALLKVAGIDRLIDCQLVTRGAKCDGNHTMAEKVQVDAKARVARKEERGGRPSQSFKEGEEEARKASYSKQKRHRTSQKASDMQSRMKRRTRLYHREDVNGTTSTESNGIKGGSATRGQEPATGPQKPAEEDESGYRKERGRKRSQILSIEHADQGPSPRLVTGPDPSCDRGRDTTSGKILRISSKATPERTAAPEEREKTIPCGAEMKRSLW